MKINKRNLLTAVLALLCTIALALGVSFVMPKVEKINADAATATTASTIKPTLSFGEIHYVQTTATTSWGSTAASAAASFSYANSMSATNPDPTNIVCTPTSSGNAGTINTTYVMNTYRSKLIAVPVILTFDFPANTIYNILWDWSFSGVVANQEHALLYFTEDFSTLDNFLVGNYEGNWSTHSNPNTFNDTVVYNNTNTDKNNYTLYGMYYAYCNNRTGLSVSFTFDFSLRFLEGPQIDAPQTSGDVEDTYTGDPIEFGFKYAGEPTVATVKDFNGQTESYVYDKAYECVELDSVTGTTFDGDPITIANNAVVLNDTNNGEGTFSSTEAGTYKVKLKVKDSFVASGVRFSDGSSEKELTFTINRKGISVPTVLNSTQTYKADEYEFGLSNYDKDIMSVNASACTSNVTGATITWDSTVEKFKATNAATYTVKFHMDSANYIWTTDGGESPNDQGKTITINKKELSLSAESSDSASDFSWDYGSSVTLDVKATASGITSPDFKLEIYYIKDGDTSNPLDTAVSGNAVDVSKLAAGSYTLCVALNSTYANNKNYSIANDLYQVSFTINSSGVEESLISWQFTGSNGDSGDLMQDDVRYKQDPLTGSAIKYTISAKVAQNDYMSLNDYTKVTTAGSFKNGIYTYFKSTNTDCTSGCSAVGEYVTRLVLNTDKDHAFDDDHKLDNDGLIGWVEISWEIKKGVIDQDYLANLNQHLLYTTSTDSTPKKYDPDNPPEYGSGSVTIQIDPDSYKYLGITGVTSIMPTDKSNTIGSMPVSATFKVDTDNYEPLTSAVPFTWEIAKQSINVEWTVDYWTAANGDEYQIRVLQGVPDALLSQIEYEYYLADKSNDYEMVTPPVGRNDTGLQSLITNHGASLTDALPVYVKVVLKNPDGNYRLVDKTGNPYDCATLFMMGTNNTEVHVKLSQTSAEYGSGELNAGILSLYDTINDGDLDRNLYVQRIYLLDSDGNEYDWDNFDFANAKVGKYTLKIDLTPAGEEDYVLSYRGGRTITITPKAIPVPTLSDIVFNNQFIDLRDYLGGSWNDYQSIIQLGGTYDGVKNVGKNTVTLTLTDENYCWDYGTDATPTKATVKFSLVDGNVNWTGTDTVAACEWSITPYVLKTSGWNLSGKEGAAYTIPAALTDGLDVDINYLYHTDKASNPLGDGESLEAGKTYFVKAQLIGTDASNFVFEDSNTTTSDFATYKIPKSGVSAALGAMKDFFTKTWLGLAYWMWLLIALAILLFLIIIIAIACKRRKSKEEREEIKARKEEEKQRKEEERQRREEERQAQKERLEAERELAKAKQEAELEKIRMQAQMGAGMASMAMQQPVQQVQQPVAQPVQQQQQPVQQAIPQQMPQQQMPQYIPMPMPQYPPQPSQPSFSMSEVNAIAEAKAAQAIAEAKAAQAQARAAEAIAEAKAAQAVANMPHWHESPYGYPNQPQPQPYMQNQQQQPIVIVVDSDGQVKSVQSLNQPQQPVIQPILIAANADSAKFAQKPAELPQSTEEDKSNSSASYPPDAVITTTTTVDTTKKGKSERAQSSDDGRLFDIDGFYDNFENK